MDTIKPLLPEEAADAWRLWKAGIIRENYARLDVPGVVIVFECADVAEAKIIKNKSANGKVSAENKKIG